MTGHQPFSKLRDAMSPERQAANKEAAEKAGADSQVTPADAQTFGSRLVASEGALPEDFDLDV
jgi:hypothetical protein